MFAVPSNTKTHVEDVCNELRDAERGAKHKSIGRWGSYYRVLNSPACRSEDNEVSTLHSLVSRLPGGTLVVAALNEATSKEADWMEATSMEEAKKKT